MENHVAPEDNIENIINFQESLLMHYETLVKDMSSELVQCKSDLQKLSTANDFDERESSFLLNKPCIECKEKEKWLVNLTSQLEIIKKAKEIQATLLETAQEQLKVYKDNKLSFDSLTTGKSEFHSKEKQPGNFPRPVTTVEDLFTRWKLLQLYTAGLESRIEKIILESNVYRKKLLENKLENEVHLKKQSLQKLRDIETVKSSFVKEIEYLKESIEKSKKEFHVEVQKRLDKEKQMWVEQQKMWVDEIDVKVASINADREALMMRDTQMSIQLREIVKDLLTTRKQLEIIQHENWRLEILLKMPAQNSEPIIRKECLELLQSAPIFISSANQTDPLIETKEIEGLRKQMVQFQQEFQELCNSKDLIVKETADRITRILQRVKELEEINYKLEKEVTLSEEKQQKCKRDMEESIRKESRKKYDGDNKGFASNAVHVETPLAGLQVNIFDVKRIEEKRREVRELTLSDYIKKLERERNNLLRMLDKQKNISSKWETEYKTLLQSIQSYS